MARFIFIVFLAMLTVSIVSCGDGTTNPPDPKDDFNRAAMLTAWSDHSIIPAYSAISEKLEIFNQATARFIVSPDQSTLTDLQAAWKNTYISWQHVAMFEIGKAEELALRAKFNTYPTDAGLIESLIVEGNANLELPSNHPAQGLPAVEYLLYGIGETQEDILNIYTGDKGTAYLSYLERLGSNMQSLLSEVVLDWDSGYREVFISADGNSATASVDRFVNDYLFYYEKFLRAGKVGIPAGVFSTGPLPENVECRYQGDLGKTLLRESLKAFSDFFNGNHRSSDSSFISLATYLDELDVKREELLLSQVIADQFATSFTKLDALEDNLKTEVETHNTAMLELYDALQQNVVYLKVDMLQALNINVDFVDADGD